MVFNNFESIISNTDCDESFQCGIKPILMENFPKIQTLNKTIATTFKNYRRANLDLFEEYSQKETYLIGLIESQEGKLFFIVEPGIKKHINSNIEVELDEVRCLKSELINNSLLSTTILTIKKDLLIFEKTVGDQVNFECYDKESLEYIFNHVKCEDQNCLIIDIIEDCIKCNSICPDITFTFHSSGRYCNYSISKNSNKFFGGSIEVEEYIYQGYIFSKEIFDNINIYEYLNEKDITSIVKKIKILSKNKNYLEY